MTSMSDAHKEKLREEMVFLIENMTNVEGVLDYLESKKVFKNSMTEEIRVQATPRAKVRELLMRLPKRGPHAFDIFVEALVAEEEFECAKRLKPDACSPGAAGDCLPPSGPPDSQPPTLLSLQTPDLPDVWPDMNICPEETRLVLCQQNPAILGAMKELMGKSLVYSLGQSCRGICFIVNNIDFSPARSRGKNLDDRTGSQQDCEGLNSLFKGLSFDTNPKKDLSAQDIRRYLRNLSKKDHSSMDCLVLVILSHGVQGHVLGVDGEEVPISEIEALFDNKNCQSLTGKPKMIFIQACQGDQKDEGVSTTLTNVQPVDSVDSAARDMAKMNIQESRVVADAQGEVKDATKSHMCVIYATTPENMSWRHTAYGTWFIQAVIYIFKTRSHCRDLVSMLTEVNNLVNKAETGHGFKQVSKFESSLTKSVYFFPGLRLEGSKVVEFSPHS